MKNEKGQEFPKASKKPPFLTRFATVTLVETAVLRLDKIQMLPCYSIFGNKMLKRKNRVSILSSAYIKHT